MRSFLAVLVMAAGVFGPAASAAVIYDTTGLASAGSQFVGDGTGGVGWWAQGFSTGASNRLVTDVTLLMSTNGGTAPWTFDVGIYTDASGEPGALVQTIYSISGSTTAIASPFSISGLSVLLDAATDYFVVVAPTAGQLAWSYTGLATGPSGESLDSGASWTMDTTAPQQMSVTAAVPEPSAVVLAIGGVAALGLFRLRRRDSVPRR